MKKNAELLAPVGSYESLHAALRAGADSIYFGVEQLNMRAKSVNGFSMEDIHRVAGICREHRKKAYLTLNTTMYDHDIQLINRILKQAAEAGIDGIIAADFAVMEICRKYGMPVHISTQANVSNIEAVKFFARYADVIVLARELTLKQVGAITREIERKKIKGVSGELIKIEIFVHGALCMAISGKCYMSLHTQNASANRGACTQNCRRPYTVTDKETQIELEIDNEYIMSPKDLCTIDILDQVMEAGVDVLKIEGRGKGPEYVFTTISCYRKALNAVVDGSYNASLATGLKEELETVYNRGFWEGYYLGRKLGEWTSTPGSAATEKKIYLGKSTGYYPRIQVAEFLVESGTFSAGDTVLITGKNFGIEKRRLEEFYVNGISATIAKPGDKVTFPSAERISKNDKLYKLVETSNA